MEAGFRKLSLYCVLLCSIVVLVTSEEAAVKELNPEDNAVKSEDVVASSEKGLSFLASLRKNGLNFSKSTKTLGFVHGFVASISVIIVSELGDKTFFIAAIMAMRYARITVFSGAISALGLMTVLSAFLGMATTVIPYWVTYYLSTILFVVFGLRMIQEGLKMSSDEGMEELEEVQAELKKKEEELSKEAASSVTEDPESGIVRGGKLARRFGIFSPILVQAFVLTFLAEWGDRSQLTTIILAAREDVAGVIVGGTIGHALCTGLAVIGGRMIAQKISLRTVTITGGVVFLFFAISSLFISPHS